MANKELLRVFLLGATILGERSGLDSVQWVDRLVLTDEGYPSPFHEMRKAVGVIRRFEDAERLL